MDSLTDRGRGAFVFLDGHVQWLDYTMDPEVFRAVCTIAGEEVVPPEL